ncbi:MAG TPA: hypothetical protein VG963_28040, partial [Polyangiaceae bacterium]|nr:hypothetical protein [Polyangiaceae bacterium]
MVSVRSAAEVTLERFALGTFSHPASATADTRPFPGIVLADHVIPLHVLAPQLRARGIPATALESLASLLEDWPRAFPLLREVVRALPEDERSAAARNRIPVTELCVHAPLPKPGTVYCSGANYKKHVAQLIV